MANKIDTNFVEEVWFAFGIRIGKWIIGILDYQNNGEVSNVKFSVKKAFFGKKDSKKYNRRLLGFYHSHPAGDPYPSNTDDTTMDAWVKATGKPLICGIFSSGKQKCFLYKRESPNSSKTIFCTMFSKFIISKRIFIAKESTK